MPVNKNALIRYKTIDRCLRNRYRRWTLEDLVRACSDALYEFEGKQCGVSVRTVQGDIQVMRSDKLGYEAPIEVYDHKYYRYSDPDYSITNLPLTTADLDRLTEAVDLLRQLEQFDHFDKITDIVARLQDSIGMARGRRVPIVDFERNNDLKGLEFLNTLYNHIARHETLKVRYQSFKARQPQTFIVFPHLLKEYRNRWFLFCSRTSDNKLYNFALDRMVDVQVMPDIAYRDNPDFDPLTYFDHMIGVTDVGVPQAITFRATRLQAAYIATKPIHHSQRIVEQHGDGSVTFEVSLMPNPEFYAVMLGFGSGVTILSPAAVATQIQYMLRNALDSYDK